MAYQGGVVKQDVFCSRHSSLQKLAGSYGCQVCKTQYCLEAMGFVPYKAVPPHLIVYEFCGPHF